MAKSNFENLKVYQSPRPWRMRSGMSCWDGIGLLGTRSAAK